MNKQYGDSFFSNAELIQISSCEWATGYSAKVANLA